MEINLRKANIHDVDILDYMLKKLILVESSYDNNLNKYCIVGYFEHILRKDNYIVYIATYKTQIVGFICGIILKSGSLYIEKVAEIDLLYVDKEYRHKGIGTKLIEKLKEYLKTKNVKYLEVSVLKNNEIALNSYKNNGFKVKKYIMSVTTQPLNDR